MLTVDCNGRIYVPAALSFENRIFYSFGQLYGQNEVNSHVIYFPVLIQKRLDFKKP